MDALADRSLHDYGAADAVVHQRVGGDGAGAALGQAAAGRPGGFMIGNGQGPGIAPAVAATNRRQAVDDGQPFASRAGAAGRELDGGGAGLWPRADGRGPRTSRGGRGGRSRRLNQECQCEREPGHGSM